MKNKKHISVIFLWHLYEYSLNIVWLQLWLTLSEKELMCSGNSENKKNEEKDMVLTSLGGKHFIGFLLENL